MPFNIPLTTEQREIVDGGGYYSRSYLIFCPNDVVFQCRPAVSSAEDVIGEFTYDNVTEGDYEDVRAEQTIIISTSTDIRNTELWRGRIRELPTSDTLYINESSIVLDTDYYVTVIDTHEPTPRLRSGNFVDWNVAPEGLQPLIKGLQSAYLKEPDENGEAEFTFSPVGQALGEDTEIDDETAWAWEIDGVTYDTREVTVTLEEGHYWARVWLTDDQPVTSYFVFQVIVANEDSTALVRLAADGYEVTGNWDNGWNGNVAYFDGIDDVLDRTRVVIVSWHQYRDGDPAFPNISFVGYLRQEDDSAQGDETYSTTAETRYTLAGFTAIAGEMPFSPLAIRNVASPTLWDEINLPTTERAIAHILTRYSTLLTLCALDFGTLTNDHFGGDMDVSSSSLLDACTSIASEINAQLIFAPCGQITLRRNACFTSVAERNDLDVITTPIIADNMLVLNYKRAHIGNLAQIQVGCRTYYTAGNTNLGLTATAPAIAFAEGMDFDTAPNQLLIADATQEEARGEATQRAGDLLAYRDDADEITIQLDDGWAWMVPSQHQWWSMELAASVLTAGRAFSADDRLLLKSITHAYSAERGTRAVNVTFRRETKGGLAAVRVEVVPSVVTTQIQVHPPLSAYLGGFAPAPSLRLPSLTPNKRQPYRPKGFRNLLPLPPAIADEVANAIGQSGCFVQNPPINFRNPANVATNFVTVLGEPYSIFVKGSARITDSSWCHLSEFLNVLDSWTIVNNTGGVIPFGTLTATGVTHGDARSPAGSGSHFRRTHLRHDFASTHITKIRVVCDYTFGGSDNMALNGLIFQIGATIVYSKTMTELSTMSGTDVVFEADGSWTDTNIQVSIASSIRTGATYSGAVKIKSIQLCGLDESPFVGDADVAVNGDAFYHWSEEDMSDAQLYTGTQGLIIDNSPIAVPPIFNPMHEYSLAFNGTGNVVLWRFAHAGQSQAENKLLYAMICGPGAGE